MARNRRLPAALIALLAIVGPMPPASIAQVPAGICCSVTVVLMCDSLEEEDCLLSHGPTSPMS
jgi:hypothetical protein